VSSGAATAAAASAGAAASGAGSGRFCGASADFWRLLLRGGGLLLPTLGLYRFWLATDVRRYLWTHSEIAGDGLEYVGTARELILGFLVAIAFLVPVNAILVVAALDFGPVGRAASAAAAVVLALLGPFAVYRARRYRLSRTVWRGIPFHQSGSAWRFALRTWMWWIATAATLGLALPFARASLERFKLGNTFYGNLRGGFAGSGTRLFLRGLPLWLVIVGPTLAGLAAALGAIDWPAALEAARSGAEDVMGAVEGASPGFGKAVVVAALALGWAVVAAAILYPAFQALVLRWWIAGLRFGPITAHSRLRTSAVYAAYAHFVWYAALVLLVLVVAAALASFAIHALGERAEDSSVVTAVTTVLLAAGYLLLALAYSTIYQATVRLPLWRLAFDTLDIEGLAALDEVGAAGQAASAVGEGLADALHVGGY
jgi:uncharacterized membrane protein YjgN (DUF898 family)